MDSHNSYIGWPQNVTHALERPHLLKNILTNMRHFCFTLATFYPKNKVNMCSNKNTVDVRSENCANRFKHFKDKRNVDESSL